VQPKVTLTGVGRGFASADNDQNNVGGLVALESEDEFDVLEKEDDMLDAEIVGMDNEGSIGSEVDCPLIIGQSLSPFRKRGVNRLVIGVLSHSLSLSVQILCQPSQCLPYPHPQFTLSRVATFYYQTCTNPQHMSIENTCGGISCHVAHQKYTPLFLSLKSFLS
jgi:hypothetical protein